MALPLIPAIVSAVGAFVASKIGEWAIKAVVGVGFGVVAYKGVDTLLLKLKDEILSGYGRIPNDLLALLSIGGFTDGIEIMVGGMGAYISLVVMNKFTFLGNKK